MSNHRHKPTVATANAATALMCSCVGETGRGGAASVAGVALAGPCLNLSSAYLLGGGSGFQGSDPIQNSLFADMRIQV